MCTCAPACARAPSHGTLPPRCAALLLTAAHSTNVLRAALWYLGNYYYNIFNKQGAKASGGAEWAFSLAWAQLAVGCVYAIFLWAAPEARPRPNVRCLA